MIERKKIKKAAKKILKAHYSFLVIACMISGFIATEFSSSFDQLSVRNDTSVEVQGSLPSQISASQVLEDVLQDNIEKGKEDANIILNEEISENDSQILGRTRGVFATVINSLTSGSIFVSIVAAINSMVGSENLAILIMIGLGLLLFFLVWFYIQNTFAVILRRIFLESRIYEKVSFERFMFLSRVKRWNRASFTMFVCYIYQTLWSLTIVGGFIKHYAYFLVPYIIAENPDIKANQAISLSRKMMKGHKWECFKIDITFIGWTILSSFTFGLSAIFFSNPYKMATFSEYYVGLRQEAKNKNIENINLLNDTYLFEIASEQTLKLAYPESSNANIEEPSLPGVRGFFAKWFGILFKKEKDYEEKMHQVQLYEAIEDVVQGRQYPRRLFPIKEENRSALLSSLNPLRDYTIWSLILMFFIFSGIGWIWEVSLHLITDGVFVNRGALHGPWLPIYGSGGILILVLLKRFRNKPMLNFFLILLVCGILEYTTSYVMEMNTGLKWWDYSGYFLNLNGRICAEGLSVFGIGGMAFVYILAPVFDNLIEKIKPFVAKILCIVLLIVFSFDAVYSHFYPNTGEGITDYQ